MEIRGLRPRRSWLYRRFLFEGFRLWSRPKLLCSFKERCRSLVYLRSTPAFAAPEEPVNFKVTESENLPLFRVLFISQFGIVASQCQVANRVQPLGLYSGRIFAERPLPLRAKRLR